MTASIEAYVKGIESGKFKANRDKVYMLIHKNPGVWLKRICLQTGIGIQGVSARLSELEQQGLILAAGEVHDDGSKFTRWVTVSNDDRRTVLAEKNRLNRFKKWADKAKTYNDFIPDYLIESIQKIASNA